VGNRTGGAPVGENASTARASEQQLYNALCQYGGLVRHILRNILGDRPEEVEDCFQETFIAFWQNISDSDLNSEMTIDNQRNYLCGIARNKARTRLRRILGHATELSLDELLTSVNDGAGNGSGTELTIEDKDIATLIDNEHDAQLIEAAVLLLANPAREIFVLRYWYCESVKAIAQQLGMSAKSIENILYRGKKQLRSTLIAQGLDYREHTNER